MAEGEATKGNEMKIFKKVFLGSSSDGRTNRWKLICQCVKEWKPTTTRFAKRDEQCPKCERAEIVDYNDPTP